jgi:antitoxin component YwqK of YwqJK toxin-antitoxin module
MRKIATCFSIIAILLFSACIKKVYQKEVKLKNGIIYYQNAPFTGEVWTDDDATGYIGVKNGKAKDFTYYHENGKEAIAISMKDSTQVPQAKYFDDEGKTINENQFKEKYTDLLIKILQTQSTTPPAN